MVDQHSNGGSDTPRPAGRSARDSPTSPRSTPSTSPAPIGTVGTVGTIGTVGTVDAVRGGTPAQTRELRARGRRSIRRLLDAGRVVIDRRGYHSARVEDIVKEAEISHGTFYLYFASKDELFRALATEVADELITVAVSLGEVSPESSGRDELRGWLESFASAYQRNGSIIRAWTEIEVGGSDLGRLGTDVLGAFSSSLARRVSPGAAPDLDLDTASLALMAMVERALYYSTAGQTTVELSRLLDTMVGAIHDGMFGHQPFAVCPP